MEILGLILCAVISGAALTFVPNLMAITVATIIGVLAIVGLGVAEGYSIGYTVALCAIFEVFFQVSFIAVLLATSMIAYGKLSWRDKYNDYDMRILYRGISSLCGLHF